MKSLAKVLDSRPNYFAGEWLSVSKVKTFKDCPAKYRYNYIESLPRKTWDFHVFGHLAHSSLEFFHEFIKNGDKRLYGDIMVDAFDAAIKEHDKSTSSQREEIRQMMDEYLDLLSDLDKKNVLPNVIGVEDKFHVNIDDKVMLNGFIDKVQVDPDGMLHVVDYKTTKNKSFLAKDTLQLQTYAYVKCLQDPNLKKVRTSYVLLRHGFESMTKEYSRKQIMKIEKKFLDFAENIRNEKLWRPSTSKLCRFCDFLSHCKEGKAKIYRTTNVKYGECDWS